MKKNMKEKVEQQQSFIPDKRVYALLLEMAKRVDAHDVELELLDRERRAQQGRE